MSNAIGTDGPVPLVGLLQFVFNQYEHLNAGEVQTDLSNMILGVSPRDTVFACGVTTTSLKHSHLVLGEANALSCILNFV